MALSTWVRHLLGQDGRCGFSAHRPFLRPYAQQPQPRGWWRFVIDLFDALARTQALIRMELLANVNN